MKKIIIAILIIGIGLVGRYFYKNHQKQHIFKIALLRELQSGISSLDFELENVIIEAIEALENLKEESRDSLEINERFFSSLEIQLDVTYRNYVPVRKGLKDNSWKSLQQSGFLTRFSSYELEKINNAYSQRKTTLDLEKGINDFVDFIPLYLSDIASEDTKEKHLKLYGFYTNYWLKLIQYRAQIYQTIWAYEEAIKILDSENQFIKSRKEQNEIKLKKIDSINKIKSKNVK